jgi:hypothetical protein
LLNLDSEYLVFVSGSVRDPGPYLAESGTSLEGILDAAGGVQRSADLSWIEVTSTDIDVSNGTSKTLRTAYKGNADDFEKVSLRPLDSVRVRQVFSDRDSGFITDRGPGALSGHVRHHARRALSSILERAGGLTDEAYAYGAVFTRVSAAILGSRGKCARGNRTSGRHRGPDDQSQRERHGNDLSADPGADASETAGSRANHRDGRSGNSQREAESGHDARARRFPLYPEAAVHRRGERRSSQPRRIPI